jgi:hypothetical protein
VKLLGSNACQPWIRFRVATEAVASLRKQATEGREPVCSSYLLAPILNILVPHSWHTPSVAGRPFFMVTCFASFISRWVLHFMQ